MEDTKAIAGTVVVENPRTGEILALANRPTFNPNVFNSVPLESLKNRAVSDVYEPGSVFKIVTYSAAIDEHVVTPEDHVDCQHGSIDVFGMKIHDHESLGVVTIAEALAHSSDVAAIKVGHEARRPAALPLHPATTVSDSRPESSCPVKPAVSPSL